MSYLMFGIRLFIFNILFELAICPFYWKFFIAHPENYEGMIAAVGPIYITVLA